MLLFMIFGFVVAMSFAAQVANQLPLMTVDNLVAVVAMCALFAFTFVFDSTINNSNEEE